MTIRSYVPVLGRNTQRVCGRHVDGAGRVPAGRGRVVVVTAALVRADVGRGAAVVVGAGGAVGGVVECVTVEVLAAVLVGAVVLDVPDVGVGEGEPHMLSVTAIAATQRSTAAARPMNRLE